MNLKLKEFGKGSEVELRLRLDGGIEIFKLLIIWKKVLAQKF
jgi:hypothetical protein